MARVETVRPPKVESPTARYVVLGTAILGVAVYAMSIFCWILLLRILEPCNAKSGFVWEALPRLPISASAAPLLFGLFLAALLCWRRRPRRSKSLVITAVSIAAVWSFCDAWTQNWQIHVESLTLGQSHRCYNNWPWMTELDVYVIALRRWFEGR
jgi:hypothetical protein